MAPENKIQGNYYKNNIVRTFFSVANLTTARDKIQGRYYKNHCIHVFEWCEFNYNQKQDISKMLKNNTVSV